jgi:hypothetical protein
VRLEAATTARVNRGHDLKIVLQPTVHELEVDRVIAPSQSTTYANPCRPTPSRNPSSQAPRHAHMRDSTAIWAAPGSTQDKDGFIPVNHAGQMCVRHFGTPPRGVGGVQVGHARALESGKA